MHLSSFESMRKFVERHLNTPGKIADVGSLDINGTYRPLFNDPWEYTGIDIVKGKNVDIAVKERYNWKEIKDNSFDVVISGQTLEHIDKDKDVIQEMYRILKPKGLCCIIVPSAGPQHEKHDYRRYTNEGLNNVMVSNGFSIIESYMNESMHWRDIVVIARKQN